MIYCEKRGCYCDNNERERLLFCNLPANHDGNHHGLSLDIDWAQRYEVGRHLVVQA